MSNNLNKNMKPIYIKTSRVTSELPLDSSHWWGHAALPIDTPYPTYTVDGDEYPYTFICQINLADIADIDTEGCLPHKGLLSFFGRIDHYLGDLDEDMCIGGTVSSPDMIKVIYSEDTSDLDSNLVVDEEGEDASPDELKIEFVKEHNVTDEDHGLLVPPEHREWDKWEHPYEDWIILFQMDSFDGEDFALNFMDCGVLDFIVSPEALKRLDFSNVRALVLST